MPQEQTVYRWNNIISLLPATLAMSLPLNVGPSLGLKMELELKLKLDLELGLGLSGRPTANLRPKIEQFEIQSVARRRLLSTLHSRRACRQIIVIE